MRGVLAPIRRQSEYYSHSHSHTRKTLVKNKAKSSARFSSFSSGEEVSGVRGVGCGVCSGVYFLFFISLLIRRVGQLTLLKRLDNKTLKAKRCCCRRFVSETRPFPSPPATGAAVHPAHSGRDYTP